MAEVTKLQENKQVSDPALLTRIGLLGSLPKCANCESRSVWQHLWRGRLGATFEGEWTCSQECTMARIGIAVRRELEGRKTEQAPHRHRVPIGLVMLEQGWITQQQLRAAVEAQRSSGTGKLGDWLVDTQGVDEQLVTRALSLQWNCPVLSPTFHDADAMAKMLPRLFVDAFDTIPLRVAAGSILYLAFQQRIDPVLAFAVERMLGLRVETGFVRQSLFRVAHERQLHATFPKIELIEVASEAALVRVLERALGRSKPAESRLVRIHDLLWMRMWLRDPSGPIGESDVIEDVVCSLATGWQ